MARPAGVATESASVSTPGLRGLLDRHGLRLRRELGQNFLVDEAQADRLADLAGVAPGERVVEVGTGLGCLTRALARRADRVISIEIDSGLVRALGEESLLPENVELIHGDVMKLDLEAIVEALRGVDRHPVRFVANLPYSVATPLMRRLLDLRHDLLDWSVMLQREVGDRLFAEVGTKDYGSFAVLHHLCAEPVARLPLAAGAFFPAPKVDSVFQRMRAREDLRLDATELKALERVVRAAFGKRRKTLANALRGGGFSAEVVEQGLDRAGIDPRVRAERVEPERFLGLARSIRELE